MRKVIYAMSVSLDGFIEATDGDISWSFPDEELHKHFNDREREIDIYLYGRRLYENMAAYWPTADMNPAAPQHEIEYARSWRSKPKIVFSKTLDQVWLECQYRQGKHRRRGQ
ncbi:MAG: dihydrofolate reductase family protein [Anaerolineales bacterium]